MTGTVTAESDGQGRGSVFTVKLPVMVKEIEPTSEVSSENAQSAAGTKRRILVVDDNHDSATSMAMMLDLLGNQVSYRP